MTFDYLYKEHYKPIFNFVFRFTRNTEESKDICQEVFIKLYDVLQTDTEIKSTRSFLFRIASNICINQYNKRKIIQLYRTEYPIYNKQSENMEKDILRNEQYRLIEGVIDSLSKKDKALILLQREGFSYNDISEITKIKQTSVGKTLSRVIQKIDKKMTLINSEYSENNISKQKVG